MRAFLFLTLTLFCLSAPLYAEETITLERPPASLSKWYKPANKRNVWHHNMFKLRREIQAVNEYMAENDKAHTEKWALRLVTHYRKIGDMVPEWKDELELEWADKLEVAAKQGDFSKLDMAMRKVQKSCKGCHDHYRAQVAALQRAPDFDKVHVQLESKGSKGKEGSEKTSYLDFMKILMRDINRIKIAAEDGNKEKAQAALKAVRSGVVTLRSSCDSCHKDERAKDYYLGKETHVLLDKLEADIKKGESGHSLGIFAVEACARCHGSHRIVYDLMHELE